MHTFSSNSHANPSHGVDVFIIASSADEEPSPSESAWSPPPSRIINDLRDSGYKCCYSNSNDVEQETLMEALKDCKVVVACVSDEFIKEPACFQFLYVATQVLRKPVVPVWLGEGEAWLSASVGLMLAGQVYVKFDNLPEYNTKMKELKNNVERRIDRQMTAHPKCFISYCWANCLGQQNPRDIKTILENKGIPCWLDIEQVGKAGLFEDIAEGLKNAEVMIACVSDEYVQSKNCQMELIFAVQVLRLPVIIVVMNGSTQWRNTQVGMLTQGFPEINFSQTLNSPKSSSKFIKIVNKRLQNKMMFLHNENEKEYEGNKLNLIKSLQKKTKTLKALCSYIFPLERISRKSSFSNGS